MQNLSDGREKRWIKKNCIFYNTHLDSINMGTGDSTEIIMLPVVMTLNGAALLFLTVIWLKIAAHSLAQNHIFP
jgi:hypothetical protein